MSNPKTPIVFDRERAKNYDESQAPSAPLFDALRFFTRLVMADLPAEARVLCVGVGTGSELIDLAQANPGWRFVAVDPAQAMLDVCRARVAELGLAQRCTFHEGKLDSLPACEPFDGATCFMVSHGISERAARIGFFREIAERLKPGAILVSSDLASDITTSNYQALLATWIKMMQHSQVSPEDIEKFVSGYGPNNVVLPPRAVEAILEAGGFKAPVLFFQGLLIHGWHSRRALDE